MARKLVRPLVTVLAPFVLAGSLFYGLGWWRQSRDAEWCRRVAASGVVAGGQRLTPEVAEKIVAACTVQHRRQRVMFGAIWRTNGQESARCGFELARLQLVADEAPAGREAILERYGFDGSDFETSDRPDQDRFFEACLNRHGRRP